MTTVSGGVKGLVARAQREAQRRAQSPSTAYLLLVMLQTGGPMGRLLSQLGVKESDLLSVPWSVHTGSPSRPGRRRFCRRTFCSRSHATVEAPDIVAWK
jgi:hypothetical protein